MRRPTVVRFFDAPLRRAGMLVREILDQYGRGVHTASCDLMVDDAVHLMARENTNALIVVEGEKPVGIFTTSDLLRTYVQCKGRPLTEVSLVEVMTNKLIVAGTEDDVGSRFAIMLQTGIGCLPVAEGDKIVAILFLRALARHQIDSLTADLISLHEYLGDLQDALAD